MAQDGRSNGSYLWFKGDRNKKKCITCITSSKKITLVATKRENKCCEDITSSYVGLVIPSSPCRVRVKGVGVKPV